GTMLVASCNCSTARRTYISKPMEIGTIVCDDKRQDERTSAPVRVKSKISSSAGCSAETFISPQHVWVPRDHFEGKRAFSSRYTLDGNECPVDSIPSKNCLRPLLPDLPSSAKHFWIVFA